MPRHNDEPAPKRKPKGKKRPRSWHHGVQAGVEQKAKLDTVAPAFAAAELDREEVARAAAGHRASVADWDATLAQCSRVSGSCALAPWPAF